MKIWKDTRYTPDKTKFNQIAQELEAMMKEERNNNLPKLPSSLSDPYQKNIWKAVNRIGNSQPPNTPMKNGNRTWIGGSKEKACAFTYHIM